LQKLGDLAGSRSAAETLENLNLADGPSLYNAARARAVIASMQAKAEAPDAARLAREEADRAMAWLTKAVAAGWKDTALMGIDGALDFLRDQEDFKKLLTELGKSPEKK
jgi:uncharacterized protein YpiB (UPF0302 family)